jgi:hypothetical protein
LESLCQVYGPVVTKAINQRRTEVTSALKKAYEKRHGSGKPMPSIKELKAVIFRKCPGKKVEVPTIKTKKPGKDCTDQDQIDAYNQEREDLQKARDINADIDFWYDNFVWYWTCLLPAVCSKHRWGPNLRNFCTISSGVYQKDASKKLVTDSDEAFVLACYENCERRWPYCATCKKNGVAVDETHDEYMTRWCDDSSGQKKFGGWTNDGRARFSQHFRSIAKNKAKSHVADLEKKILRLVSGKDSDGSGDESGDDDNEYGGEAGKVWVVDWNPSKEELAEVNSDVEDLPEDGFRKCNPKKKAKKAAKMAEKQAAKSD